MASGWESTSSANGVYVPAMSRKIIEWSSRRIHRRTLGVRQVTRWYSALVPSRPARPSA